MKKTYKELQKKLSDNFTNIQFEYSLIGGIKDWLNTCNIKPTEKHINILCKIFNNYIPLVYKQSHRLEILKFLKNNKYKQFKKL